MDSYRPVQVDENISFEGKHTHKEWIQVSKSLTLMKK
jgi:hypothetical protein